MKLNGYTWLCDEVLIEHCFSYFPIIWNTLNNTFIGREKFQIIVEMNSFNLFDVVSISISIVSIPLQIYAVDGENWEEMH